MVKAESVFYEMEQLDISDCETQFQTGGPLRMDTTVFRDYDHARPRNADVEAPVLDCMPHLVVEGQTQGDSAETLEARCAADETL